jgi:uncharacterized protein (TIGR00369 family)
VVYPGLAALSGLEQLRAMVSGRAPDPSVARLTGRRIVSADVGTVTYLLPATAWMLGPKGEVHSGLLAFLADGALFASVVSVLPARVMCTTAELSMTFLGRPPRAGGDITARGQLIHLDEQVGLAEVFVHDGDERLVAHGTSRCAVFEPVADTTDLAADSPEQAPEPELGLPDPHLRPPPPVDAAPPPPGADGLERMRRQLRGEVDRPPVDQLTGIHLVEVERGRAVFGLPASPWLRNEFGNVYGGVLTLLAKSAAAAAVQTTAAEGVGFTALDVKINFLRAVAADGSELVATGTVLHAGRRLAIATADVMQGDVRVCVLTGTTALTARP